LDALGVAAGKLRTELGESLATVQKFDVPLQQATTSSLEALRAYSLGRKESGEQVLAWPCLTISAAIQLDPNFAMANYAWATTISFWAKSKASEYFSKAFESAAERTEKLTIAARLLSKVSRATWTKPLRPTGANCHLPPGVSSLS